MYRRCEIKAFVTEQGIAAPMPIDHIDTDAIIPKQYLKVIVKSGFGKHLFAEWRYLDNGQPNPDFILNQAPYDKATFIISGENFGCGSSREHAVWAIDDFGIRAVLAKSFSDIFYSNCFKNGVLPVRLAPDVIDELLSLSQEKPLNIEVDLLSQVVRCENKSWPFEIDEALKKIMLEGLDGIAQTLKHKEAIKTFEQQHQTNFPWLFAEDE